MRPRNWIRLASTLFARSELAVQLYDDESFEHATFADLQAAGGPFVHINATDLAGGNHFTFFQLPFDLICSDLSQLKIARAVAASSAVPGIFTPVTLRSYASQCGLEPPAWLEEAGTAREEDALQAFLFARPATAEPLDLQRKWSGRPFFYRVVAQVRRAHIRSTKRAQRNKQEMLCLNPKAPPLEGVT